MSSVKQSISRLRELRLAGMAEAYELQLQQPRTNQIPFDDRFGLLVEYEVSQRTARKLKRIKRGANMSDDAALEDVDVRASRGIDPTLIGSLASCEWIRRQQNLIINGATGVGKTWLACAFGDQACRHGLKVLFYRISDLYDAIGNAILWMDRCQN